MIAHDKDTTERLFQRAQLFLKLLKGPKPVLGKSNEQELHFAKTGATFFIGTAGSKNFGRGDTITDLHCSEFAFWKDPKQQAMGLFQAVPHSSGFIGKECTANGYGTYHHRQFMKAWRGEGRFKARFYPWYIFKEYASKVPLQYPLTPEEMEIQVKFSLSENQIQWRREKIQDDFEGEILLFQQEYPATMEEAFLVSGGSLFPNVRVLETKAFKRRHVPTGKCEILEGHPNKDYHYVFGIDTSGGTGNDYSTIEGLCVETQEEVLAYSTNVLPPPRFAEVVLDLAEEFNKAYLVPEANQHGISLISCIRESSTYNLPGRIWRDVRKNSTGPTDNLYGYRTTQASKYRLIGTLQKYITSLNLYCYDTGEELKGYGEDEKGKLSNIETKNDDRVIALALACLGLMKMFQQGIGVEPEQEIEERHTHNLTPGEFRITLEDVKNSIHSRHNKGKGIFSSQV